jgi:ribosomal protein L1
MIPMMWHLPLRVLAVAAVASAVPAAPAAAQTLVGTLKCTAEIAQGAEAAARDWKLSCAFEQASGSVQHYAGAIKEAGPMPRVGKALFVWNVVAAVPEVKSGMLVGTYKESKPGANMLIGGLKEAILLQPAEPSQEGDGGVIPRVRLIQLELPRA